MASEAAMASEPSKKLGNMHINTMVIEVADFKFQVKFDF